MNKLAPLVVGFLVGLVLLIFPPTYLVYVYSIIDSITDIEVADRVQDLLRTVGTLASFYFGYQLLRICYLESRR